ncbi:polyprenyl synthetase family protein [Streptomyces sp. NPDC020667]|uniref:polyprenyl synthetase family protein n=1 Tax=Streptomyces sp. NPDC020667 TaxID=3154895 RepID=UPI0033D38AD7
MTGALLRPRDISPTFAANADFIRQRIDRTAERINHHIDRLCPNASADACSTWLPPGHITGTTGPGTPPVVAQRLHRALTSPVRHLTDAGGQRWRPVLAWEAIGLMGGDSESCGLLIAASELLHTGSLIVDDVQDASPLRRGQPAVHTMFGMPTAVNAGTAAYFLWERAVQLTFPDDASRCGELRALGLAALRAAHAGQALDLQGHREEMDQAVAGDDRHTVLELVRLTHRLKSGAPVSAAMEAAGVVTGAEPELRRALGAFGSAVGTAYQIADDVADLSGVTRAGAPTKQATEDLRSGKVTMPLAHAVVRLPQSRLNQLWQQVKDGSGSATAVAEVCRDLNACGAVRACLEEADQLVSDAWNKLEPLLPSAGHSHLLYELALSVVRRDQVA